MSKIEKPDGDVTSRLECPTSPHSIRRDRVDGIRGARYVVIIAVIIAEPDPWCWYEGVWDVINDIMPLSVLVLSRCVSFVPEALGDLECRLR